MANDSKVEEARGKLFSAKEEYRGPDAVAEDATAVKITVEDSTAEDSTAELSKKGGRYGGTRHCTY